MTRSIHRCAKLASRLLPVPTLLANLLVLALTCTHVAFASDPAPEVSVAAVDSPVAEGQTAAFELTLDREPAAALTVSVNVTETGSMLAASIPQSVTFSVGDTSATLNVTTVSDTVAEPDSWVTAAVSAGTGYTVGWVSSATVHVEDGSSADRPEITLACTAPHRDLLSYGTSATWRLSVEIETSERVGRTFHPSNMSVTDGQRREPYIALFPSCLNNQGPAFYDQTCSLWKWSFEVPEDTTGEIAVGVKSGAVTNADGLHSRASAPLYVAVNRTLSVTDSSAVEASGATVDFTLTLDERNDCETVTVDYTTLDVTATAGADYTATSGTLTFGPGRQSRP